MQLQKNTRNQLLNNEIQPSKIKRGAKGDGERVIKITM